MSKHKIHFIRKMPIKEDPGIEIPTLRALYANPPDLRPNVKEVPFYELEQVHARFKPGESRLEYAQHETTGNALPLSRSAQRWHITAQEGQGIDHTLSQAQSAQMHTFIKGTAKARNGLS